MCGIAGIAGPHDPSALAPMLEALRPRGPDEEGRWHGPGVSLGIRRLVVIDAEGGKQPMADEAGRFRLVFNGEIYNFAETRSALEREGIPFRSRSDTEVLLRVLAREGEAGLSRLRGMFAFAIHDAEEQTLTLVRDRLGKKPLYWMDRGGLLAFASEVKALLAMPGVSAEIDPVSLEAYLAFGYVPGERTIVEGIRRLRPGHLLRWRAGRAEGHRWWTPPPPSPAAAALPESLWAILEEAVRLRLISDVPLGVFLSAGLDSAAILAAARRRAEGPLRAYTLGFGPDDAAWSEETGAAETARALGAEHRVARMGPDLGRILPPIVRALDEPFADASAIPTWLLAGAARREITVALSGIGGDEIFGGYPRYLGARLAGPYRRVPSPLRALLAALAPREGRGKRDRRSWARRFLRDGALPFPERYIRWVELLDASDRDAIRAAPLSAEERAAALSEHRGAFGDPESDPVDGAMRSDLLTYLPENLLAFGDRVTMAWGLELRTPLLDHLLVEWASRIPGRVRMGGFRLKGLFREALARRLPAGILRRPKQGFQIPLGRWFDRTLMPWARTVLDPSALRSGGLLHPRGVQRLLDEHASGRRNFADAIWGLAVLEAWRRIFVERDPEWVQRSLERPEPPALSAPTASR